MAITKPITTRQFDELMENLDSYNCVGFSHNSDNEPSKWETLSFKYDGSPFVGLNFHVSHPLTADKSRIDYDTIVVRFHGKYPIEQEWAFRITDKTQVDKLTKAVAPHLEQYRYRPSL